MRAFLVIALTLLPWLGSPGRAQTPSDIILAVSTCRQQISLLVSAVPAGGSRRTLGWFTLPPNQQQMLLIDGGGPLSVNPADPFYIYAILADNSDAWQGSDLTVQWQGQTYRMERRDLLMVTGSAFPMRAITFAC